MTNKKIDKYRINLDFKPLFFIGFCQIPDNTFVEYYATGGILYLLFILFLLAIAFKHAFKSYKVKPYVFGLFISLVFSQLFYGMFESIPILVCDFFGAVFGMYMFLYPNLEYLSTNNKNNCYNIIDFRGWLWIY